MNEEPAKKIPTPYEWMGGIEKLEALTSTFYDKVLKDELLEPVFRNMSPEHSKHVAAFLGEVFQGPPLYSSQHGEESVKHMVGKHIGRMLTEQQRKRWMDLLLQSADEVGLPADPEFRSTFVGHIEWGTRIALINSQLTENPVTPEDGIPNWGWGEVGGPYGFSESLFHKKKNVKKEE
jgi:hemoglobin